MRIPALNKVVGYFTLLLLSAAAPTHLEAASPDLLKAKQDAQARGYIFFATHDEIVAMAKKEGKLKVSSGLETPNFKPLVDAFKQKYPFITDLQVAEIQGTDAYQRFLLEIRSGQAREWDITHIPPDFGKEYIAHLM